MNMTGLRYEKRIETKATIADAAVDLFLERGFRHTLVDDIAKAARVSRRTFFNYYPTKQDILSEWFRSQGEYLVTSVSTQPKEEPVWKSLQTAYGSMHSFYGQNSERILKLRRLLIIEPLLMAKKYECLAFTMRNLTPVVEQRLKNVANRPFMALVFVQAAMGAYNAACADWESNPQGRHFKVILKRAFSLAEPAIASRSATS